MQRAIASSRLSLLRSISSSKTMGDVAGTAGMSIDAKLVQLGYKLPTPTKSVANYIMCNRVGNIIYTAGHLPVQAEGGLITGKVGSELTTEQAYDAARVVGLNIIATLKAELGDLDKVKKVVKLTAFVNCVDGYQSQPKVVNGCSDLLAQVFGDKGKHARSAVGVNGLPLNVPVEIEAIVECEP